MLTLHFEGQVACCYRQFIFLRFIFEMQLRRDRPFIHWSTFQMAPKAENRPTKTRSLKLLSHVGAGAPTLLLSQAISRENRKQSSLDLKQCPHRMLEPEWRLNKAMPLYPAVWEPLSCELLQLNLSMNHSCKLTRNTELGCISGQRRDLSSLQELWLVRPCIIPGGRSMHRSSC